MEEIFSENENFRGYRIERLIGRGGLGAVYLAQHITLDGYFALKILDPETADEKPEYVKRFVREAKIASKIRHPNLVQVHDAGFDEAKGVYFIVMDYVSGSDLRTAIAMGGAMEPKEAVQIIAAVASALAAGEPFGMVHRDIKPENIMLAEDGSVKLVDLGVAKAKNTDSLVTISNTVFGTPNYISPEQAQDSSAVDARADVYSLGIVLYELLCGRRPYNCNSPSDVIAKLLSPEELPDIRTFKADVPQKLAVLLQLMCAKSPEKRIASASALLDVLKRFGYDTPSVKQTSVGLLASPKPQEQPVDYAEIAKTPANDTLSFETRDEEISKFVKRLKARRRIKRIALAAAIALLAVAAVTAAIYVMTRP